MFDTLSEKLQDALAGVRERGTLTEDDVDKAMREIRLALLEADVNFKVVKSFTATVKERCLAEDVIGHLNPGQQVVKIVNEELTALMGGAGRDLAFSPRPPTVVLMAGLQGSGKTTACAKLARHLRVEHGSSVALAACDVYRPAAVEQLVTLGERAKADVYERGTDASPVEIAAWARERAEREGKDVLIVDTSGRLHVDEDLMRELADVRKVTKPHSILLVVDAMTGQDAVNVAEQFAETVQFDGVVMTKLDGDARGGAALSVKAVTGKPVIYASTGEKLDQFERFHPDRMAQRILGMGDVLTFIEKAEGQYDADQAAELERKMRKAEFTLEDFLSQLKQVRTYGAALEPARHGPGPGRDQGAAGNEGGRAGDRPSRGDHPLHDSRGAPAAGDDQGLPAPADRQGLGDERAGGQSAGQAVRPDAEADAPDRPGQDTRPGRPHAPGRTMSEQPDFDDISQGVWEGVSGGWKAHAADLEEGPHGEAAVRMLDAAALRPGERVLELACGPAGVGLQAARAVEPEGSVLLTDFSEGMVQAARDRATELGIENVEFAVADAQRLDLPDDSFDAALCRFGYMLMGDPFVAMHETARVLRPGGRIALAVWGEPADNAWIMLPMRALLEHFDAHRAGPRCPGRCGRSATTIGCGGCWPTPASPG